MTGLPWERTVHFALRAVDDMGNVGGPEQPGLRAHPRRSRPRPSPTCASSATRTTAVLRFTAPGADRNVGRATRYEVFVETRTIRLRPVGLTPWRRRPRAAAGRHRRGAPHAPLAPSTPRPTPPSAPVDDVGNAGDLSPVVSVVFPDTVAPRPRPRPCPCSPAWSAARCDCASRPPATTPSSGTPTRFEVAWAEAAFAPFAAGTPYAGVAQRRPRRRRRPT